MKKILIILLVFLSCKINAQWNTWTKYVNSPVYSHSTGGGFDVASDPVVIKDGSSYFMVVSRDGGTFTHSPNGNSIILATSSDGFTAPKYMLLPFFARIDKTTKTEKKEK